MATNSLEHLQQGQDRLQELNNLGAKLSEVLHCPISYPAFDKNLFVCKHGITFPAFMVKAAYQTNDWSRIIKCHLMGQKL